MKETIWPCVLVLAACGGRTVDAVPAVEEATAMTNRSDEPAPGPPAQCDDPAAEIPPLTSYLDASIPGTYWIEVVFDGGEWRPAEPLPMPHHHATRLELGNTEAFPSLAALRTQRLRFTIEVTSRDVQRVPGRHEWRATWHARIVRVCPPG